MSLLGSLLLLTLGVHDGRPHIYETEGHLVTRLAELMRCRFVKDAEFAKYCRVSFEGLELEFAGVDKPGGGGIYIYKLGKKQVLRPSGFRCVEIRFHHSRTVHPPVSRADDLGLVILFRDDGQILPGWRVPKVRETCWQR